MKTATRKRIAEKLTDIADVLTKCGGPGGTMGPCPTGGGGRTHDNLGQPLFHGVPPIGKHTETGEPGKVGHKVSVDGNQRLSPEAFDRFAKGIKKGDLIKVSTAGYREPSDSRPIKWREERAKVLNVRDGVINYRITGKTDQSFKEHYVSHERGTVRSLELLKVAE